MNILLNKCKDEVAKTIIRYEDGVKHSPFKTWERFLHHKDTDKEDVSVAIHEVAELYAKYSRKDLQKKVDLFDKELDLVHRCLTDLCDIDHTYPIIKKCLDKIEKLKS